MCFSTILWINEKKKKNCADTIEGEQKKVLAKVRVYIILFLKKL
jgi:hypothetical protein